MIGVPKWAHCFCACCSVPDRYNHFFYAFASSMIDAINVHFKINNNNYNMQSSGLSFGYLVESRMKSRALRQIF